MIEQLKNLPLFHGVDIKVLEGLINNKQIFQRWYHKGVAVHEQHTDCYGMDVPISGKLIAYSLAPNGSETIMFEFSRDSIIGANLLFNEQNKYPMNIYSTTDCLLIHITKSAVKQLLKHYEFVMEFVKSLSLNSQGMNKKITMYSQKTLRENLMDYFLVLSTSQKSNIIHLPITKKQLADYFGVQRPSLFRELKRMKDEGLIIIDNKVITLNYLDS